MKTNSVHLLLVMLLLSVAISTSAFSASIRIEAEDYVDSHDIAFDPIAKVPGSSCSGGYMLVGLDAQGEWTEYNLPVSDFGVYTVKMLCRGNLNWTYSLDLILTSGETGETQTIQVSFVGLGYGWSQTTWLSAAGSGPLNLFDPSYTVRLRMMTNAYLEVDRLTFSSVVPTENRSWGMIKSIYSE